MGEEKGKERYSWKNPPAKKNLPSLSLSTVSEGKTISSLHSTAVCQAHKAGIREAQVDDTKK